MLRGFKAIKENSPEISVKLTPLLAFSAGLYPLIYIYTNNFSLLSSWYQFLSLLALFILLPLVVFISLKFFLTKFKFLNESIVFILTFLNLCLFMSFIIYSTFGLNKKLLLLVLIITFILSFWMYKYINKLIKFQILLAGIGVVFLLPTLINYYNYDDTWLIQNDDILELKFKKKPNIYLIQPDGYVGFSEIEKVNYNFDNSDFSSFLELSGFTLYPNYRSNYPSTLSSNSSMFGMKHHFYNYNASKSELLFARDVIVGKNPVLTILKNNGYKSSLILENSYLLVNRPKVAYDYCNFNFNELPLMGNGFEFKKDVNKELENALERNTDTANFYFVEKILPGHIATYESYSKGKEIERLKYIEKINEANKWLEEMVGLISKKDPNGLIIIASDHGGFVGFDYTSQAYKKPENEENVYSMFSSLLAIKWPDNEFDCNKDVLTSVNLFKVVFSYLSEEKNLLDLFEADNSYLKIYDIKNSGLFEVINNKNIVFKKIGD